MPNDPQRLDAVVPSTLAAKPPRYLRNGWCVAAWSDEVGRSRFARTIPEQSVLLYRKENGDVAAIGYACPHRPAPLAMGKPMGNVVQRPYHGLRFDAAGSCVLNPHGDGTIPPRMKTPFYPVVERHGRIWLWFGDEDKIDASAIPGFSPLGRLIENGGVPRPQNPPLRERRKVSEATCAPIVPAL